MGVILASSNGPVVIKWAWALLALMLCQQLILASIGRVFMKKRKWQQVVLLYALSYWFAVTVAFLMLVAAFITWLLKGSDIDQQITVALSTLNTSEAWANRETLTVSLVIAALTAILIITIEVFVVRPYTRSGPPVQRFAWLFWFVATVVASPLIDQAIDSLPTPTEIRLASAEESSNALTESEGSDSASPKTSTEPTGTDNTTTSPLPSDNTDTPNSEPSETSDSTAGDGIETIPSSGLSSTEDDTPANAALLAKTSTKKSSILQTALAATITIPILLALAYWGWVSVGIYHQLADVDKVRGPTGLARRLWWSIRGFGLNPKAPPFQSLVIGPKRSGKSSLFAHPLDDNQHPEHQDLQKPNAKVVGTSEVYARTIRVEGLQDRCGASTCTAIDTGGEYLGDQLAVLNQSRVDRLIVVLNLDHFAGDVGKRSPSEWELRDAASLYQPDDTTYTPRGAARDVENAANYLKALMLVNARAGKGEIPRDAAKPQVQSVLIILNAGGDDEIRNEHARSIDPKLPLALARSIANEYPMPNGSKPADIAAWITNLHSNAKLDIRTPNIEQLRAWQIVGGIWKDKQVHPQITEKHAVPSTDETQADPPIITSQPGN